MIETINWPNGLQIRAVTTEDVWTIRQTQSGNNGTEIVAVWLGCVGHKRGVWRDKGEARVGTNLRLDPYVIAIQQIPVIILY